MLSVEPGYISLFTFQCTLPILSHTIHSDNFTMCDMCPLTVTAQLRSLNKHVTLHTEIRHDEITSCQSPQTMQKTMWWQFLSVQTSCYEWHMHWTEWPGFHFSDERHDAYVDWSSNLLLTHAEPWYQFICINDLPRLLNSVTVGHLFVKYCRVSSNELLFSKRRDKIHYCLFCET